MGEIWPDEELDYLIRALCASDCSFYLPEQAHPSIILRQYQPVEFGWNPKSDKVPGIKSYSTSLVQDNAWCIPLDENLFWFIEGDAWMANVIEVLDRCLERIIYFGRAEALTQIVRVVDSPKAANVILAEPDSAADTVPVLVPSADAMRTVIQFALGWAVAPELRATVRLTARFRSAVLRNIIRTKTSGVTVAWNDAPAEVRDAIAEMAGKDSKGKALQGPRRHAEFFLWWDGGVPTRLLVWRGGSTLRRRRAQFGFASGRAGVILGCCRP
jgi:hypothetical protein